MFLPGMKTYIIAAIMVAKAIYAGFTGEEGYALTAVDYKLLLEGLGLGALRAGVAKGGK